MLIRNSLTTVWPSDWVNTIPSQTLADSFADLVKISRSGESKQTSFIATLLWTGGAQTLRRYRAIINWQNGWSRDSKWVAGACTWLDQTFLSMALIRTRKGIQTWLSFSVSLVFAPIGNNRHVQKHMQSRAARDIFLRVDIGIAIIVYVLMSMQRHWFLCDTHVSVNAKCYSY